MRPIIFDSFAGGGGASTGIEMALGRSPDLAINHNPVALAMHAANHPDTIHISENVWRMDPLDYLAGKHVGLAWFSPDCKHFSKAKGGKPVERNIRDLAWIIPGWIERIQKSGGRVDVAILENVEEFRDWSPLVELPGKGLMPDPERKGETFIKWCRKIRALGGKLQYRELRACDYGAPTIRKRLFIIIRFDGGQIVWPKPTHGAPDDPDVLRGKKKPYVWVADSIDWSLPCPSIFATSAEIKEEHGLASIRPLADATMSRVARGVARYVLNAADPFVVSLTHHDRGDRCEGVREPITTITGANRGEKAIVTPVLAGCGGRAGQSIERPGDKPLHTTTSKADTCLVAPYLVPRYGERPGQEPRTMPINAPGGTIVPTSNQGSLATVHLMQNNTDMVGHDARKPLSTIVQKGCTQSLVISHLTKYYGVEQESAMDEPMCTATSKARFAKTDAILCAPPLSALQMARAREVAAFLRSFGFWDERELVTVTIKGVEFVIVDIGMRMLTPRELFSAQGFPTDYVIELEHEGRPLSKSDQIACCGNSVCPPVAEALVAANCNHLIDIPETIAA